MNAGEELFTKDKDGRVVELKKFFEVFPEGENGRKMLFGGKVLEVIDELSGSLATLFVGTKGLPSIHVGHTVIFMKPIRVGESALAVSRVVFSTKKIICVHTRVFGGNTQLPGEFTKRYEGFGLCAVLDANNVMVKNLEPYTDRSEFATLGSRIIGFQRKLVKALKSIS
ncbi:MAG: hotdog domain-containing protein [bacterium]|nr:hotdog domain-containing protein [bacterium]